MGKKRIPRGPLDEAIALTREYHNLFGAPSVLSRLSDASKLINNATGILWFNIENLLSAILSNHGIKPDATSEDIYAILRQLGWEVSD